MTEKEEKESTWEIRHGDKNRWETKWDEVEEEEERKWDVRKRKERIKKVRWEETRREKMDKRERE